MQTTNERMVIFISFQRVRFSFSDCVFFPPPLYLRDELWKSAFGALERRERTRVIISRKKTHLATERRRNNFEDKKSLDSCARLQPKLAFSKGRRFIYRLSSTGQSRCSGLFPSRANIFFFFKRLAVGSERAEPSTLSALWCLVRRPSAAYLRPEQFRFQCKYHSLNAAAAAFLMINWRKITSGQWWWWWRWWKDEGTCHACEERIMVIKIALQICR